MSYHLLYFFHSIVTDFCWLTWMISPKCSKWNNFSCSTLIALSLYKNFIILFTNCFYPNVISIRDNFKLNWKSLKSSFVNQCFTNHFFFFGGGGGGGGGGEGGEGIHSMQGWTATTRHRVTRKRSTKMLKHKGNRFRKNLQLDVC